MKLLNAIKDLKKMVSGGIKKASATILYKEDKTLIALLKAHSPSASGEFKSNWKASRKRFGSSKTLAGLVITNDTPLYGQFLAFGADPEEAPWYFPGRDKKGKFTKHSGKLKAYDGKIWAGGLNPGHAKTIGGPISQVLSKRVDSFTEEFANGIVKGFV